MGTRRYFRNPGMWGLQYLEQTSIGTCANIYNHNSGYESDDIGDVGRDLELRELMKLAAMPDRHYNCLGIWVMPPHASSIPFGLYDTVRGATSMPRRWQWCWSRSGTTGTYTQHRRYNVPT